MLVVLEDLEHGVRRFERVSWLLAQSVAPLDYTRVCQQMETARTAEEQAAVAQKRDQAKAREAERERLAVVAATREFEAQTAPAAACSAPWWARIPGWFTCKTRCPGS